MHSPTASLSAILEESTTVFTAVEVPVLEESCCDHNVDRILLVMVGFMVGLIFIAIMFNPWLFIGALVMNLIIGAYICNQQAKALAFEEQTIAQNAREPSGSFIIVNIHSHNQSADL